MLITGEVGWTWVGDDIDVGVLAHAGALLGCDTACREGTFRRDSVQFVGGLTVKADVLFHPRVGVGLFGRVSWRNLDVSNSDALLSAVGLSVSFFL